MRRSVFDNEKGFTILEAVFAAGILAFAILSYTMLKTSSRHSQVFSKQLSQAIQLSDSLMDDFARRGYNDPLLSPTAGTVTHQFSELLALTIPAPVRIGDFALGDATWTVKEGCPGELSKLIKFTGKWNMEANPPKEFTTTRVLVRP
jgi:type II secretory pathway pseudopilin PulG